jgi:hypothetical protein
MFGETRMQVSPATMSHPSLRTKNCYSTLFTTGYKRPTEGGLRAFAFALRLLAFWCGRLLEGKRIAEGKGNCQRGIAKEELVEE